MRMKGLPGRLPPAAALVWSYTLGPCHAHQQGVPAVRPPPAKPCHRCLPACLPSFEPFFSFRNVVELHSVVHIPKACVTDASTSRSKRANTGHCWGILIELLQVRGQYPQARGAVCCCPPRTMATRASPPAAVVPSRVCLWWAATYAMVPAYTAPSASSRCPLPTLPHVHAPRAPVQPTSS